MITINKNIVGMKRHLVVKRDESVSMTDENITEYNIGFKDEFDISRLSEVAGSKIKFCPPEPSEKIWKLINPVHMNWPKALGKDKFISSLQTMVRKAFCFIDNEDNDYYLNTLPKCMKVIDSLENPLLDLDSLLSVINDSNIIERELILKNIDKDKKLKNIEYSFSSSATGRLTVKRGLNILTLKKDKRKMFKANPGKKLVMLDIKSLEPRIAAYISNEKYYEDVYSHVADNILQGEVPREIVKKMTLSIMYGMSIGKIRRDFKEVDNVLNVVADIRSFLGCNELVYNARQLIQETGYFKNYYGRRLKETSSIVNHYLQSSGVDVSLLCFSDFLNKCRLSGIDVTPNFVIHDALVFEIPINQISKLEKVKKDGLNCDGFDFTFPVTFNPF